MYLPRKLEHQLLEKWEKKKIFIIEGPRRSGKTTLIKRLQEVMGGEYITFEDPSERKHFLKDPVGYIKPLIKEPIYLDEVQYLGEKCGSALKLLYDTFEKIKIVATGSGAFPVKMGLKAYLVGRAYFYTLLPLSFGEFVLWKSKRLFEYYREGHQMFLNILKTGKRFELHESPTLEKAFSEYVVYGGYPEVVLKDEEELKFIVQTTIEQDIVRYFSLRKSEEMWNLVEKLAAMSCNIIHFSTLGIDFRTAAEYISILKRSYIVELIRPYYTNPLTELTKTPKICFYDCGFRNAVLDDFLPFPSRVDKGQLLEIMVFRQLREQEAKIRYWRTKSKAEVDFVLKYGKAVIPIEVKSGQGKITRAIKSFMTKYSSKVGIIIGFEPRWQDKIIVVPPYYL